MIAGAALSAFTVIVLLAIAVGLWGRFASFAAIVLLVLFAVVAAQAAGPVVFAVIGFLVLGVIIWMTSRASENDSKQSANRNAGHPRTSAHAQELLPHAKEIEPGLFRHPHGLYVARGPRGGLRIYKSVENARLYRDLGPSRKVRRGGGG